MDGSNSAGGELQCAPVQGGATCFDRLGVCVQPEQGKALLFFPAFADGRPDPRYASYMSMPESWRWNQTTEVCKRHGDTCG